jgi:hypothetical protein
MKGLEDSPYVLVASHSCDIVNPKSLSLKSFLVMRLRWPME